MPLDATARARDRRSRSLWVLARLNFRRDAGARTDRGQRGRTQDAAIAVQRYTGATPEVAGGFFRLSRLLPAAAAAVFFIACANVVAFFWRALRRDRRRLQSASPSAPAARSSDVTF